MQWWLKSINTLLALTYRAQTPQGFIDFWHSYKFLKIITFFLFNKLFQSNLTVSSVSQPCSCYHASSTVHINIKNMAAPNIINIFLQRPTPTTPWGFRVQGGADTGHPLFIQRVSVYWIFFSVPVMAVLGSHALSGSMCCWLSNPTFNTFWIDYWCFFW